MKKSDAEQYLANRKSELAKERIYGPKPEPPVSFADFADDFLATDSPDKRSKARDESVIGMLKVEWKGLDVGQITVKMIEDYKAKRLKHREKSTVARELQVVKRLFKKAAEWGKVESNPAATVTKPTVNNNRVRFLEPEDMDRLMAKVPEWLQPIAVFARHTGARRGEILNLRWSDVDFKRGRLTFRETKNGEHGHVEMNETVRGLLNSLPAPVNRAQRVFQLENTPAVWMRIGRAWTDACRAARIGQECACRKATAHGRPENKCRDCKGTGIVPDFHFHDLRHQAATDLLTLKADLNDVRDFLRHKSMVMTLRYAHLVERRRKDTACLLDRLGAVGTKAATATPGA